MTNRACGLVHTVMRIRRRTLLTTILRGIRILSSMSLAKRWVLGCLLALFRITPCDASEVRNGIDAFLTKDGQLTAKLALKDAQAGFAGDSGTAWTIDPDGTFRVARFFNDKVEKPYREGQLNKEELVTLAKVLTAQGFFGLPTEVGRAPEVNRRRITISFGEKTSTLVLRAGQDIMEATPRGGEPVSPQGRFSAIVQAIQRAVEDDKSDRGRSVPDGSRTRGHELGWRIIVDRLNLNSRTLILSPSGLALSTV